MENIIAVSDDKITLARLKSRFAKRITPREFELILSSQGITKQMALAMLLGNKDLTKSAISSHQFKKWLQMMGITIPMALAFLGQPAQAGTFEGIGGNIDRGVNKARELVRNKASEVAQRTPEFIEDARELAADGLGAASEFVRPKGSPQKAPNMPTSIKEQNTSSSQEMEGEARQQIDVANGNMNITKILNKRSDGYPLTPQEQAAYRAYIDANK